MDFGQNVPEKKTEMRARLIHGDGRNRTERRSINRRFEF
jgi:hypothetical protein